MIKEKGFVVLESGFLVPGTFHGGRPRAGEMVFNTSHSGYEEMATDPSYFGQILVMTAPQQGNYGIEDACWESDKVWINGFICTEIQQSKRDSSWSKRLQSHGVPVLTDVDTRKLVLHLREQGTTWGAVVKASHEDEAIRLAGELVNKGQDLPEDWTKIVSRQNFEIREGSRPRGPRIAIYDFGTKENIVREIARRAREVAIFPSGTSAEAICEWDPDGILLSNGPGDPAKVVDGIRAVKELIGRKPIFGICMGQQILALALGGRTYKLRFGHRGSNHPIQDRILNKIYVASQNHGYNVDPSTLPSDVQITHTNLNDNTIAGLASESRKCWSVQFHPESCPGPHEASQLFDFFIEKAICTTTN